MQSFLKYKAYYDRKAKAAPLETTELDRMPIANDDLYAQSWNTILGSNPFDEGPSEYSQIRRTPNTSRFKYRKITAHPPHDLQNLVGGGSPVEQTTEPDENFAIEIPQRFCEDDQDIQKTQKDKNNTPEKKTQKTPESSQNTPLQKEPINTRGEKYNLRPNPNPYSDTYSS